MDKVRSKFELGARILILSVFVIVVGLLVKQKFFNTAAQPPEPTVGRQVALSGDYFRSDQRSVILVLQTTCGFCNASMPFYKRLMDLSREKNINYIAVFPQTVEEGTRHLNKYGVAGLRVVQSGLDKFEASGTPTLIITDDKGVIERVWVGKLTPDKESEVVDTLKL
jgi:thiol-disulfide isomerase/thioredoxin